MFYQTQALNCACMRPSTLALVEEFVRYKSDLSCQVFTLSKLIEDPVMVIEKSMAPSYQTSAIDIHQTIDHIPSDSPKTMTAQIT